MGAVTRISLAIDGVQSVINGMGQVRDKIGDVSHSVSALSAIGGALSVGAFAAMIKASIDTADHLNDLSKSTGISIEQLAGLKLAASQSGTELDTVAKTVNKLSTNMGQNAEKFARLGITAKSPIEAFKQLSDIYVKIEGDQKRAAFATAALGRGWELIAPLLAEGGDSIGQMVEKGARLSGMTQQMANDADEFNDRLEEMKTAVNGIVAKLASEMLPAMTNVSKAILQAYNDSGKLEAAWVALGGLGAFLYTDEFSSTAVKIKDLQLELSKLQREKKDLVGAGYLDIWLYGTQEDIDKKIAATTAQIDVLKKSLQPKVQPKAPEKKPGTPAGVDDFIGAKAVSDYKKLTAAINEKISANVQELAVGHQLTDSERALLKISADRASGAIKLSGAEQKALEVLLKKQGATERQIAAEKLYVQAQADAEKAIAAIYDSVDAVQAEIEAYTKLPSAITAATIARLEEQRAVLENFDGTSQEVDNINRKIAAYKQLANVQGVKEMTDNQQWLDDLLDPSRAQDFGAALMNAFNGAGNALVQLKSALDDYGQKQREIEKERAEAEKRFAQDAQGRVTAQRLIDAKEAASRIDAYANMAGAAKDFFSENSKGYKTLENLERTYRAVELALSLKSTAAKLFGITSVTTATVASAGTQIAVGQAATAASVAQSAEAFAAAAPGAIAKAGSQTGWVGAIAMAGLMAILGFAGAGGFDTGAGGISAADRQKTQGTGTVLGDAEAKSESVTKSLESLKGNSDITLTYTAKMLNALNSIDAAMSGLAAIVARTTGIATGNGVGVFEGTLSKNTGDPILKLLGGFDDSVLTRSLPLLGGIVGNLQSLWGKTTQEITDSGLSINGSIANLAKGQGYGQYTDVTKTESSFFGLVKNSSSDTITSSVDAQISQQFGLIFKGLEDSLSAAAGALGLDANKARQAVDSLTVTASKISLRGLSGQALTDAINNVISSVFDSATENVLSGMEDFQRVGEGYYQTVLRVASGVETAKSALERLGLTAVNVADIVNKHGDVATEIIRDSILNKETIGKIVQHVAAQTLTTTARNPAYQGPSGPNGAGYSGSASAQQYMQSAFDTVTKTIPAYDIVTRKLSGIGEIMEALSGSADDLVKTYTQLVSIQQQMRDVGSAISGLTIETVKGAGSLDALSGGLQAYFDNFFTDAEKLKAQTRDLKDEFAKLGLKMPVGIAGFRSLVSGIDLSTKSGQKLYGQVMLLADSFASLTKESESAAASAVSDAQSALRSAYNTQAQVLQSAITGLRTFSKSIKDFKDQLNTGNLSPLTPLQKYAQLRQTAYDTVAAANVAVNPNDAAAVAAKADAQAKEQSAISAFLEASRAINASSDAYKTDFQWAQEALSATITAADAQTSIEERQLDELKSSVGKLIDIDDHVVTVAEAIFNLRATLLDQQKVTGVVAVNGSHAAGLRRVPFDGYIAELHEGESVWTAAETDRLNDMLPIDYSRYGKADNAPLIAQIKSLQAEVAALRRDQAAQTSAMIRANNDAHARTAGAVVDGGKKAVETSAWHERSRPRLT